MAALSTLGIVHTAIALVAVGAGIRAFVRYKEISHRTGAGLLYIGMTVLTCLTGFFIFAHGGPTAAHALGVLTLIVLGFGAGAERLGWLGRHGRAAGMLAYSLTFFFHFIPGLTETGTRLPAGAPLFSGQDDPALVAAVSVCFLAYLAGAVAQLRWLREHEAPLSVARPRIPAA